MAAKIERAIRQSAGLLAGRILEAAGEDTARGDADDGEPWRFCRRRGRDADLWRCGKARQARRLKPELSLKTWAGECWTRPVPDLMCACGTARPLSIPGRGLGGVWRKRIG